MNTMLERAAAVPQLEQSISSALDRIPPLWPLTHFVAVNPFSGLVKHRFTEACELLQRTVGAAPLQSPEAYLSAWHDGTIQPADLHSVADAEWSAGRLIATLENTEPSEPAEPVATVADMLDGQLPHAHWSVFVVDEISKWCGVAFDENQTTWTSPWKTLGLFAAWREAAAHDRNPEAFGLAGFRHFIRALPETADDTIAFCMEMIAPPKIDPTDFLHRQLATIPGWAGYVRYLVREDEMRGAQNPALRELLAIRMAYDAALFNAFVRDGILRANWRHQKPPACDADLMSALVRWQGAYEAGYQRQLAGLLAAQPSALPCSRPLAQAVFCIDVRSERFRRHLEHSLPGLQTIGFAGFFGFPVAHQRVGQLRSQALCPVLLVPSADSAESMPGPDLEAAAVRHAGKGAWKAFQNSAVSCFSFVESAGLGFGAALAGFKRSKSACCHPPAPEFSGIPPETRASMAEGALRNMSLTENFARLVLICGHGSHSSNNPHASSLDCGACGGHAGDVNARLASAVLNDPGVRKTLALKGIHIPDDTIFIAGLHDTLCDDVTLFDAGQIPASHKAELSALKAALAAAGMATRRERAGSLGLAGIPDHKLDSMVRSRGRDISQVRPEWGLANNAALVAAPRSRTAGLDLDGRVFLHDYDPAADPELKVLTLILCAPVVVASWINLQYYASRVDPLHYGAGDKALHNVVGGIGVMEGNGGDLKSGLPLQSIHDGGKFIHEPRRLTVFIDASREAIDRVLADQVVVRQLFANGWIHLVSLEGDTAHRYSPEGWHII